MVNLASPADFMAVAAARTGGITSPEERQPPTTPKLAATKSAVKGETKHYAPDHFVGKDTHKNEEKGMTLVGIAFQSLTLLQKQNNSFRLGHRLLEHLLKLAQEARTQETSSVSTWSQPLPTQKNIQEWPQRLHKGS